MQSCSSRKCRSIVSEPSEEWRPKVTLSQQHAVEPLEPELSLVVVTARAAQHELAPGGHHAHAQRPVAVHVRLERAAKGQEIAPRAPDGHWLSASNNKLSRRNSCFYGDDWNTRHARTSFWRWWRHCQPLELYGVIRECFHGPLAACHRNSGNTGEQYGMSDIRCNSDTLFVVDIITSVFFFLASVVQRSFWFPSF